MDAHFLLFHTDITYISVCSSPAYDFDHRLFCSNRQFCEAPQNSKDNFASVVICFSYRCDGLPDIVPLMNLLSVLNYFSSEDFY